MAFQRVTRPRRPVEQFAPAVRAPLVERIGAVRTEAALERTDERSRLIGGKVRAAPLAIGPHFQHVAACSAAGQGGEGTSRKNARPRRPAREAEMA